MKMMSGKKRSSALLAALLLVNIFVFSTALKKKKQIKTKHNPTVSQYLHRLNEFCLDDLEYAQKEFWEFIDMGLNASDAFELTVIRRVYI
jgi:hypothetical protein